MVSMQTGLLLKDFSTAFDFILRGKEQILLGYDLLKVTVTAIIVTYPDMSTSKNTTKIWIREIDIMFIKCS